MNKFKNCKGITLVALIITIIILLIVVGIAISQLTGSGLFNDSKLAENTYKNAQEFEETEIAKYSNEINKYINGNRDYTPISYSTEEQNTGIKWIDGKTLYQKTYVINHDGTNTQINHNISNVDFIMVKEFVLRDGNQYYYNMDQISSGCVGVTSEKIRIDTKLAAWNEGTTSWITIQYTKTK